MLSEATIRINPTERKKLEEYVRNLRVFVLNLFEQNEGVIEAIQLTRELDEFSKRGMLLPDLRVMFDFNPRNSANGEYYQQWKTILINLYRMVTVPATKPGTSAIVSINWSTLISVLVHEFIHYKQDMKVRSKQYGRYLPFRQHVSGSPTYLQDPDERQAWAAQYLEYIKNKLSVEKPDNVISFLKKVGLTSDPTLAVLKDSDYDSWKRIMKNAVQMVMHGVKKQKQS